MAMSLSGFDLTITRCSESASATLDAESNQNTCCIFSSLTTRPRSPIKALERAWDWPSSNICPNYTAGRPANTDYRCELRNQAGDVRVEEGELAALSFVLDPIGQEIVTCTIWNSFDYAPAIALTKVDAPTVVRGDLTPQAVVTSTFAVTNPGNTVYAVKRLMGQKYGNEDIERVKAGLTYEITEAENGEEFKKMEIVFNRGSAGIE